MFYTSCFCFWHFEGLLLIKKNPGSSNWRFLSAGKISIGSTHYVLDIFQVIAIDNQKSLPFLTEMLICISVPNLMPATDFVLKIKLIEHDKFFYVRHFCSWINHESTYTKSKHKEKKALFFDLFLPTLQSFDSLTISIKIFFNRTRKLLLWKCTLRKAFVPTLF